MWNEIQNEGKSHLERHFEFQDFVSAWGFMTQVAILAEKHNHHPDWNNVYNRVTVRLSTHDAGDIVTEKDHALAGAIDRLL